MLDEQRKIEYLVSSSKKGSSSGDEGHLNPIFLKYDMTMGTGCKVGDDTGFDCKAAEERNLP